MSGFKLEETNHFAIKIEYNPNLYYLIYTTFYTFHYSCVSSKMFLKNIVNKVLMVLTRSNTFY